MSALGHYGALLQRLGPGKLARAAARRVQGRGRRLLYRAFGEVSLNEIAQSYRSESSQELAARALRPKPGWCSVLNRQSALTALASVPGALDRARERAQRALERRFTAFGHPLPAGRSRHIPWALDPVSGYTYPLAPADSLVLSPAGVDPKFPWALGRLESLLALGQGYWASQDDDQRGAFATELIAQLTEFLDENPVGLGIHWTCAMEVSLRAANIAQALCLIGDSPLLRAGGVLPRALRALAQHCRFTLAHLEDGGAVPNNHLVANLVGLLVCGLLFPELPGAAGQVRLAVDGLRDQMEAQVLDDGFSFEGSVGYHRLAVELFALAWCVAKDHGVFLGSAYRNRLSAMFHTARAYCSQQGRAPQWGDNDSGRALPLTDRDSLDHGYLAPLGAALLEDPTLLGPGEVLPDEAAWLVGERALGVAGTARPPPSQLSSSGLHLLRAADTFVAVSAGPAGQRGVGGHSHNDRLSFELHLRGRPVIVDPGSPTYTRDAVQRNCYRGTALHNTVQVDGQEQSPMDPVRLFALRDEGHAKVDAFGDEGGTLVLMAHHRGYAGLPGKVMIRRTFVIDRHTGGLAVLDHLEGSGAHALVSRLHLPDRYARLRPAMEHELRSAERLLPGAAAGADWAAIEVGSSEEPLATVLVERVGSVSFEDYLYSPGYGQVRKALRIVCTWRTALPALARVCVLPGGQP